MHIKTMEGLVGANNNAKLMKVPMSVYQQARAKDDTTTMSRALGYAEDCREKAEGYTKEAKEGMKAEAEELKAKAKEAVNQVTQKQVAQTEKKTLQETQPAGQKTQQGTAETTQTSKTPVTYNQLGKATAQNQTPKISVTV